MTEIQCPACSALLNLSVNLSGSVDGGFASEPVSRSQSASDIREKDRLAQFNASLAAALREFVGVFPWEGHRLPGDIHADFIAWLRGAPEDREFYRFLRPVPVTKNRVSKLLVSEIGATFIKGPKGREYRLPQSLQPAGGDDPGPVAGAELAGEGSLKLTGVASVLAAARAASSLPLAEHVAAVKAQAVAEDSGVDYMFVTRDGVSHKVPLKSRGDVVSLVKEENMQEPADYSLPANLVLDGPSIFPVEAGPEPMAPRGIWKVYLSDDEAALPYPSQEVLAAERLPERLVLASDPVALVWGEDGAPFLSCLVHSVDGLPPGDGEVRVPLPWLKEDGAQVEAVVDAAFTENMAIAEAAAAPLPSSQELAAVAGHEALERARTAAAPAAPVFLAPEDLDSYEGADPGDWG